MFIYVTERLHNQRFRSKKIEPVEQKNPHFGDLYFSSSDGMDETIHVFIRGNELEERLQRGGNFHIAETGFGTGLNLLTLLSVLPEKPERELRLSFTTVEKYPLQKERIAALLTPFEQRLRELLPLYLRQWEEFYRQLEIGWNSAVWSFPGIEIRFSLYFGDVLDWAEEQAEESVDAWFLDGHSPDRNPEIWSSPVMDSVYKRTKMNGTIASFTSAGVVKQTLRQSGFTIKRKKGFARKRHMIFGFKS